MVDLYKYLAKTFLEFIKKYKMDVADFAKHVYKMLERREQDIATILTSGGIQDIENYRLLVGEIQGLTYAKEEMKSLLEKNYEDAQDIIST